MNMKCDDLEILSFEEARQILKTSKAKLRKILSSGDLKGFKIGKNDWKIQKKHLVNYIEKQYK